MKKTIRPKKTNDGTEKAPVDGRESTPPLVESSLSITNLLAIVRESIKKVPANAYAFGVVGVVAAASASILLAGGNWFIAVSGGVSMLVGMVLLKVFAAKESQGPLPTAILTWICLVAFAVVVGFLTTKLYWVLFRGDVPDAGTQKHQITVIEPVQSEQVLAGRVEAADSQKPLPDAAVSIVGRSGTTTDSDGNFVIDLQGNYPLGVWLQVTKEGYKKDVRRIFPPLRSSMTILLER